MGIGILVVDDEQEIAELVAVYLKKEGFEVFTAQTAAEAREAAVGGKISLAILDVMLPDGDGFALCREFKARYRFPIIMLTARVEAKDKIAGLELGADDYVTKPFNPLELVARVRALLRRSEDYGREREDIFDEGGLVVNNATHECTLYGKEIALTPTEFSILWLLCKNQGRAVPSEEIFETVWKEKYYESNNTVMVHIRRLRKKLGEPMRQPRIIKTVWGVGYRIDKKL